MHHSLKFNHEAFSGLSIFANKKEIPFSYKTCYFPSFKGIEDFKARLIMQRVKTQGKMYVADLLKMTPRINRQPPLSSEKVNVNGSLKEAIGLLKNEISSGSQLIRNRNNYLKLKCMVDELYKLAVT